MADGDGGAHDQHHARTRGGSGWNRDRVYGVSDPSRADRSDASARNRNAAALNPPDFDRSIPVTDLVMDDSRAVSAAVDAETPRCARRWSVARAAAEETEECGFEDGYEGAAVRRVPVIRAGRASRHVNERKQRASTRGAWRRYARNGSVGGAGGPNRSSRPARAFSKKEQKVRFFREVVRSPRQLRVVERKMALVRRSTQNLTSRTQTRSWSVGSGYVVMPLASSAVAAAVSPAASGRGARAREPATRDGTAGASRGTPPSRIRHERWVRWVSSPRWPSTAFRAVRGDEDDPGSLDEDDPPFSPRARRRTLGVLRATRGRPSSPARRTTGVRRARTSSETGDATKQRRRRRRRRRSREGDVATLADGAEVFLITAAVGVTAMRASERDDLDARRLRARPPARDGGGWRADVSNDRRGVGAG